jgi:hypothetical protein
MTTQSTKAPQATQTAPAGEPSYRANALAVGVLFIACTAATIQSAAPLGAPLGMSVDLGFLAANDDKVIWTALIEVVWAATGMGIAIGLYPVLRKFNPALALGAVAGRMVENVFVLIGALSLVAILTVSQQAAGSADPSMFQATGDALAATRVWVHDFIAMIPFGIGTLLYSFILYRSRLVPRWLSGWGLVAAALSMVAFINAGFTQEFGFTTVTLVLSAPIAFQEMTLAVWLIAKGFNQSALASRTGARE